VAANKKLVGQNYTTPDLIAKVTGAAKFAEDYRVEGMLFAKLLLSRMPHARVRRLDLTAALAVPGVRAILTADDVPGAADTVTDLGKIIKADLRNERALTNEPMYYGDPVGRWEGDTLVIETMNFKRWGLDDYYYTNSKEYRMHSDAMRTIERLRWKSPTAISYALTIDDPKIFSAPWTQEFEILAKPEWDKDGLFEYVCEENNRCPGGKCAEK